MSRRRRLGIALACFAVIALVVGLAMAGGTRPGGPLSATSSMDPTAGAVVYSDDFSSSQSGWYVGSRLYDADFEYSGDGYAVTTPADDYVEFAFAPYHRTYDQVGVTVEARFDAGAPADTGFGAVCQGGVGSSAVSYEFIVGPSGDYYIGRRTGTAGIVPPEVLGHGSGAVANALDWTKVEAICATIDARSTRLVLIVDGSVVKDIVDDAAAPTTGWTTGIAVAGSASGQTTITADAFEERDLTAKAGTGGAPLPASVPVSAPVSAPPTEPSAPPSQPEASPMDVPASAPPLDLPSAVADGRPAYSAAFPGAPGWLAGGTGWSATTANGPYSVTVSGAGHHVIPVPYNGWVLSAGVTAQFVQERADAGAGFAVMCTRGSGAAQLTYEFFVRGDGSWDVDRIDGSLEDNPIAQTIKSEASSYPQNAAPVTIAGVCTTQDPARTRLNFWINGSLVFGATDYNPGSSYGGWQGAIDIMGEGAVRHSASVYKFVLLDVGL